jgi:predicted nucleic acid-binding protein
MIVCVGIHGTRRRVGQFRHNGSSLAGDRRAAAHDPRLPPEPLIDRASELLDAVALLPLHRGVLGAAGAFAEPVLRALDAIHVAAAIDLSPLDAFVSYDERQSAAARLAGLRTVRPG